MRGTIKMGGYMIWITFVITAQFSAVLGRNTFYEYYYSRYHHKDHSTTEGLSSSTTGISADISYVSSEEKTASSVEKTASSVSDDASLKNLLRPLAVDVEKTVNRNITLLGYGNGFNDDYVFQRAFAWRIGMIVGGVSAFLIGSCCICFCIVACRRRNAVRSGFIISNNARGIANPAGPQQQAVHQQYQQPVIAQQYPPQYPEESQQLFPPQYQPHPGQQQYPPVQQQYHPVQQQNQHSPMLHNPPEAPPPYEFPEKF